MRACGCNSVHLAGVYKLVFATTSDSGVSVSAEQLARMSAAECFASAGADVKALTLEQFEEWLTTAQSSE